MRRVDRAPVKMHSLFLKIAGKLAVERGEVTKNVGRIILFVNDGEYRLSVCRLLTSATLETVEDADARCKDWGLSFHSKIAVPIVDTNNVNVGWIVGTGNSPEDTATAGPVSLVKMD